MQELKLQHFGHLMWRTDSLEKDSDAGKDWKQEEKGTTEDEVVGWHHQLNGHELEQALGDGESDSTEQLSWTELNLVQADQFDTFSIELGVLSVQGHCPIWKDL